MSVETRIRHQASSTNGAVRSYWMKKLMRLRAKLPTVGTRSRRQTRSVER